MNYSELIEQAEIERQNGNREKCLELKNQAEQLKQNELQERHKKQLENVNIEFPIGKNIPGIGTITKIDNEL